MRTTRVIVRATLAMLAVAIVGGCQSASAPATSRTIAATSVEAPVRGRAAIEQPIELTGHDVVLVPFVKETEKGWFDRKDPFGHSDTRGVSTRDAWLDNAGLGRHNGARYAAVDVRWHNAFGRDLSGRRDGASEWMLLDRRGVISSVALLTPPRTSDPSVYRVLFLATTEDTNGDGRLDARDARRAWLADGDARNPRPVTPQGLHVVNSWIDWERDTLYIRLLEDTDGDGAFTDADESAPWLLHLGGAGPAEPLVDEATVDRARALLDG